MLKIRKMGHKDGSGIFLLDWMSRKIIFERDVHFKMGVFLANSTQSLARCRECSLAGWLSCKCLQDTPAAILADPLPFQVPPDLLGQDNGVFGSQR